jgi:uncharacterized protein
MSKRNKIALAIFAILYISFGALMTLYQEDIVYYPNSQDFKSCADFQSAEHTDYNGTRMYVSDLHKPVAILYHGNAGSACDRSFYADMFTQAGYGYIIVEYAGYSADSQKPSHNSIKQNVHDVLEYLQEKNISNISVVGESIGTGVASYHASLRSPEKLLLLSPFTDLVDVAKNRFWFYPTSVLVNNAFDNTTSLKEYRNPVTIIHGNNDTIIPFELGKELFDSLKTEKQLVIIEGAGHNDLFFYPETYTAITNFLRH